MEGQDDSQLRGSGMFGFHTPKTARNMLLKGNILGIVYPILRSFNFKK